MTEEGLRPIRRALVSVSDKAGLGELARFLAGQGVEILSTGGSAAFLKREGVAAADVAAYTGFPEIMDGRVKTLHPLIHGGLLARRDLPAHVAAQRAHGIADIDLLVVNLYPFAATLAAGGTRASCIENIDIGGPALIRAAAKNHDFVAVATDPADYAAVMAAMRENGNATPPALRRRLAAKAYGLTAAYDAAIARWMSEAEGEALPERLTLAGIRRESLRYGENPHQAAAFYELTDGQGRLRPGVATARQLQGKALSYNNLADADAAFELAAEFDDPAIVIVKHANPCGVALGRTLAAAYEHALACDPQSAFGGIVAANRMMDGETAAALAGLFAEVAIAPDFSPEALAILDAKKNLRLLASGGLPDRNAGDLTFRSLAGGFLAQSRDAAGIGEAELRVVSKRRPEAREIADLLFAFRVAKHVKSNAIVYARDGATIGIGAGQMSRVDAVRLAAGKAAEAARAAGAAESRARGAVVASDAFFPFADGLLAAAEAGATAVIQPGGSLRDAEVIAAADAAGLAMVFTGRRHFRH